MNQSYDVSYWPPFPAVEVYLALRDQSPRAGPVTALIDTGADGTFVPVHYVKRLAAPASGRVRVHPHFGSPRVVHTHTLDLLISSLRLPAIEVVGDVEGTEIILGRNVLNKLILLLDGPRTQTDVLEQRPRLHERRGA